MSSDLGSQPIVACVDGLTPSLHAVRWAAAEALRRRVLLRLVHAQRPQPGHDSPVDEPQREQVWQHLWVAAAIAHETAPPVRLTVRKHPVDPVAGLLEESHTAGLVVMGAGGQSRFSGLPLGSTALALATGSRCPVVVVRDQPRESGPVVVGVTGSTVSDLAIGHAFDQAAARAETLIAVHAWRPKPADVDIAAAMGGAWTDIEAKQDQLLAQWLSGWQQRYPQVRVMRVLTTRRAARCLLDIGQSAQLVVVGCGGRSRGTGLVRGAVPRALMHRATVPVMIVRAGHGR
ncbi:universal stress protein [Kutzneria sp. CA-103260]|uniref:universal stress protein n=1 Tax=Kutzneria sp. CA-103260 TaxID=2802641 RepID=UPI001BA6CF5E|nr:universal stress protein [Kutzneria sp. CA-103260]QUQ64237.1 universal stress protein family protein [Kutzneria sp. CA-103260]